MSKSQLSFEDILNRINNNFKKAEKKNSINENSVNYNQLKLKMTTELEQVNRRWEVNPEFVITSHRGAVGKVIVFGKKIIRKVLRWYINPVFEKQKGFNASVTRTLNIMKEQAGHNSIIADDLFERGNYFSEKINTISIQLEKIHQDNQYLLKENDKLKKIIDQLLESQDINIQNIIDKINSTEDSVSEKLSLVFNHVEAIKGQLVIEHSQQQQLNERFDITDELLGSIRRKLKRIEVNKQHENQNDEINISLNELSKDNSTEYSMDYYLFENKFRGSRKVVKERQVEYLQYISQTDKVLDIGCGRGEFIELLLENGISAEGIDINKDMVEYCIERGFNVKYADAIHYLSTVPSQSFDCISMCQVIEHLTFEQYTHLLSLVHSALKPGGRVIIETINVQSVYAMSNWFYIDPTHTKPVHPETLDFVMKELGFYKTQRKNLSPVEHIKVPRIDLENVEEFNKAIGDLYGMLYGCQDYAIIAWR